MRTFQLEHMRPKEIMEMKAARSIAYLPLGPLEWHTPALPYGTDGFIAYEVACRTAQKTGGVVLPPFFIGSDCFRPEWHLEKLGFENTKQIIKGMDFPGNLMKSFYLPAEVVGLVVREYVKLLIEQEYRLIVVLSAHGAATQGMLISEICREFSSQGKSVVLDGMQAMSVFHTQENEASLMGHANISEASIMCYLNPQDVELKELPDKNQKLRYSEWGIVDRCVLFGERQSGGYVVNDPRDATDSLGKELIDQWTVALTDTVNMEYSRIEK